MRSVCITQCDNPGRCTSKIAQLFIGMPEFHNYFSMYNIERGRVER